MKWLIVINHVHSYNRKYRAWYPLTKAPDSLKVTHFNANGVSRDRNICEVGMFDTWHVHCARAPRALLTVGYKETVEGWVATGYLVCTNF